MCREAKKVSNKKEENKRKEEAKYAI